MTEAELVDHLLTLPDLAARRHFLEEHKSLLNDEVVRLLDLQAAHFLRADIHIMLEIADSSGGGRLVSVLEGGYNLDGLASAATEHFKVLRQA